MDYWQLVKREKWRESGHKRRCIKVWPVEGREREREQLMAATAAMQVQMVIRICRLAESGGRGRER